jgi:hypothetical protein
LAVTIMFLGVPLTATPFATRTWVSGVGDDANPCSRTAPCKTFQGAIDKTAAGGEISVLDPGGFGTLTITKSITINGAGTDASILATCLNGIIVNAADTDVVTLRNLQINGAGTGQTGVKILSAGAVIVDTVAIYGFDTGIESTLGSTTVLNSVITNNRTVGVNGKGGTVTLEGNMIASNTMGVIATAPATVRLSDNSLFNNQTGLGCGGGTIASANNNRKGGNTGGSAAVCAPTVSVAIQ